MRAKFVVRVVCGGCIMPINAVNYVQAHGENTKDTFTSESERLVSEDVM